MPSLRSLFRCSFLVKNLESSRPNNSHIALGLRVIKGYFTIIVGYNVIQRIYNVLHIPSKAKTGNYVSEISVQGASDIFQSYEILQMMKNHMRTAGQETLTISAAEFNHRFCDRFWYPDPRKRPIKFCNAETLGTRSVIRLLRPLTTNVQDHPRSELDDPPPRFPAFGAEMNSENVRRCFLVREEAVGKSASFAATSDATSLAASKSSSSLSDPLLECPRSDHSSS